MGYGKVGEIPAIGSSCYMMLFLAFGLVEAAGMLRINFKGFLFIISFNIQADLISHVAT